MDTRNYKQLVNEHCQREKLEKAEYVCTPDQEKGPNGFFCTLNVGAQSFCTPNWQKTKKTAELEAAKLACEKLSLQKTNTELKAEKIATAKTVKTNGVDGNSEPVIKGKPGQPGGKEPDWITIEKVEDIYKYLTDEVLAQEFKAFLHCKAQEEKKGYPVFTTKDANNGKGYTTTVTYDGKEYSCLGVMMSKKQAEQSAAEVCLRALGDFPDVPKEKYTIQVYRGGQVHLQSRKPERSSKYTHALLQSYVASLGNQFPQYCYKQTATGGHDALCYFEGKTFESGSAETPADAKNQAAFEALKFYGFDETTCKEAAECKEMLRIKHRRSFIPLGVLMSPYIYCPSKRPTWMFHHFESTVQITGEPVDVKECEYLFQTRKWIQTNTEQEMKKVLGKVPAIDGKPLHERLDISVGEINGEDKNIIVVGNAECSFRLFCKDGKIRCDNRSCDVDLLAGHNIRGLKCSYELLLPSLQVYLKAESCNDLFYPNPPLPVVTTCGMVVLMFDHEASVQEIQILLTRLTANTTFASKARSLASYLNKYISGTQSQSGFDVADCTANIDTWTQKEVKLLSEMTMESMHELMSPYVRYDDRWNEIFAKEHPDVLKELEDAASAELSRRTEEAVEEEVNNEPWVIPNSRYVHRLLQTGVNVENQLACTFRSLLEMTGLKIKLGELEKSPMVDLPCDNKTNPHRGDFSRYYIWKGLRKVSGSEDELYYKHGEMLEELGEEWKVDSELERKNAKFAKRRQARDRPRNKRQKLQDGVAETGKTEENGKASVEEDGKAAEEDIKPAVVEEEKPAEETEKADVDEDEKPAADNQESPQKDDKRKERPPPRGPRSSNVLQEECRWFTLEEAQEVCPLLSTISSTAPFLDQLQSLQTAANALMKDKAEKS